MNALATANLDSITQALRTHYSRAFAEHGPTPRGVDWGRAEDVRLRYEKMLAVIPTCRSIERRASVLDVGCGYGGLYEHSLQQSLELDYCGIDVSEDMVVHAERSFPTAR